MSTRFSISLLLSMMVSAVLFGIGATIVLSIPRLSEHAPILLPVVILLSFIFAPFCSWVIAPKAASKVLAGGRGETRSRWGAGSSRIITLPVVSAPGEPSPAVRSSTLQAKEWVSTVKQEDNSMHATTFRSSLVVRGCCVLRYVSSRPRGDRLPSRLK